MCISSHLSSDTGKSVLIKDCTGCHCVLLSLGTWICDRTARIRSWNFAVWTWHRDIFSFSLFPYIFNPLRTDLKKIYVTLLKTVFRNARAACTKGKRKVQGVPQYQPAALPDTKRKRKQTIPNNRKSNKRTKSTKISSLFPKRGNRNAKRTEKHKNKITQGKT